VEPTIVTSRGLRFTAAVVKKKKEEEESRGEDGGDDDTFMAILSCREVRFKMQAWERVALEMKRCAGFVHSDSQSVYLRSNPSEIFQERSNSAERKTIYALKDCHFDDMAESWAFWVRTMPAWLPDQPFKLARAHPHDCWDYKNGLFRVDMEAQKHPGVSQFVLAFRQVVSDGEPPGYFLVFLGLSKRDADTPVHPRERWPVEPWCKIHFHRSWDLGALDFDRPVYPRYISETCWTQLKGVEMGLDCYVSTAVMSGRALFCADLHVTGL
jgi:hypothetical protein